MKLALVDLEAPSSIVISSIIEREYLSQLELESKSGNYRYAWVVIVMK